eukprot:gene28020-34812_t
MAAQTLSFRKYEMHNNHANPLFCARVGGTLQGLAEVHMKYASMTTGLQAAIQRLLSDGFELLDESSTANTLRSLGRMDLHWTEHLSFELREKVESDAVQQKCPHMNNQQLALLLNGLDKIDMLFRDQVHLLNGFASMGRTYHSLHKELRADISHTTLIRLHHVEDPKLIASYIYNLGRLEMNSGVLPLVEPTACILLTVRRVASRMGMKEISKTLTGLAALDVDFHLQSVSFQESVQDCVEARLPLMQPEEFSRTVNALGLLRKEWSTNSPSLQTIIQTHFARFLPHMTGEQTVRTITGLAGMGLHVSQLNSELKQQMDEILNEKMATLSDLESSELLISLNVMTEDRPLPEMMDDRHLSSAPFDSKEEEKEEAVANTVLLSEAMSGDELQREIFREQNSDGSPFKTWSNLVFRKRPEPVVSILACLVVGNNFLTGTTPAEIGNLTQLTELYLLYNKLDGSIPSSLELTNLHSIVNLDLGYNDLTGTIPRELFNLSTLHSLYLNSNRLVGSIPVEIGQLNLTEFSVEYNYLSGSLPEGLYHSTNLTGLSLSYNSFTGSISNKVGAFHRANTFDFAHNLFTNTIPTEFSQLSGLKELSLQNNRFTGPVFITENNTLDVLWLLDFSNNHLSGPFPVGLYNMSHLAELNGLSNAITGSLRGELGDLVHLRYFDMSYNRLSGSIPTFNNVMAELKGFLVVDNALTGMIVSSGFANASNFEQLELDSNFLTGTLSTELCSCVALNSLAVEYNLLTGTLPSMLSNLTELSLLTLSNNMFSGRLPTMRFMQHLVTLFVQSNRLSGSLGGLFRAQQRTMSYIDIGNNQFTGTLPEVIFELPNLLAFAAVSNCLTGPIPLQVCNQTYLYFLDLDGLSAAAACQQRFVPHSSVFKSYALTGRVTNGIPSCLFAMPNMNLLHLSGNAIEWRFPSDLVISESLTDLSISHNILTGTIPNVIQLRPWTNLDLSFNRLNGELHSDMAVTAKMTTVATCLIVLVFVPLFCVLSALYPTLTVQYAWFVSAAYLKGRTPAIHSRRHHIMELTDTDKTQSEHRKTYLRHALLFAILLLNCVVMIVLNSGYVYITLTYGTELIIFAQVCVALFKLFWNDVAVWWMVLTAREFYAPRE